MIILSYDISENKVRTRFNKFITKYGYRLQYSVYKIENAPNIIDNILIQIDKRFKKQFSEEDSVIIFHIKNENDIIRYGYAVHDNEDLIMI
ncbi:CRISPR-associated endonuclease Cas2 [Granulicatella seriolae]|uniref:CRISPR-associated endonuclease Cas2 n=1 Tax=Granulicatella seriolae TaxID=2967226 RepID=UPI0038B246DB